MGVDVFVYIKLLVVRAKSTQVSLHVIYESISVYTSNVNKAIN